MDLSTTYLGMPLKSPFMPGASPLVDDLDSIKKLEDAGASAIVMHSLFEEQLVGEQVAAAEAIDAPSDSFAESLSYFPDVDDYALGPDEYLEHIHRVKKAVDVPVIASLNGKTLGGWLNHAQKIEEAGADALELNVYYLATDFDQPGEAIERLTVQMVGAVKETINIPVAVKLSPFYSSLSHFARHLDDVSADGLVLFNRFYQADIDIEELEMARVLQLSDSSELLLRLRWLGILHGRISASLACSGGVHTAIDALKAVMAGAHAVQIVSALLLHGPEYLKTIIADVTRWLEEHEYESLQQAQGSMSLLRSPDPAAFTRANYVQILQSWRKMMQE